MDHPTRHAIVSIMAEAQDDATDLERLSLLLQRELRSLELESVDLLRDGSAASGTKSGDLFSWGSLVLALAGSNSVLASVIGCLQSWLTRHERRSVTIVIDGDKLVLTGATTEQQTRLVSLWIKKHAPR